MRQFQFKITKDYDGFDIKRVLKDYFGMSERLIINLKKSNGIQLNGVCEFVIKTVREGDLLEISLPDAPSENIIPNDIPLDILYEDEDILAVNKPSGMPTHPSIRHFEGTLANAVCFYFRNTPFTFRAITRLDRYTSGVVLIAKNALSAHLLSQSMRRGEIHKKYAAVCVGTPCPSCGTISAPIKRETDGIIKRCIAPDGKPAISDYETVETYGNLSLVRLFPRTGRTHQLRLHLAHIGTPIYGDFLYGHEIPRERTRLHCLSVTLLHPFSRKPVTISAPLPDDMGLTSIRQDISL